VKINSKILECLASILYAFEDSDSELPYLDQESLEFEEELKAYKENYNNLPLPRKKGLKNAVAGILTGEIIEGDVSDLYRRIWIHESNIESTEHIIEELETIRYTKAIKYILNQAKYL